MIGFISTPEESSEVTQAIREAQNVRGLPVTWILQGFPVVEGEYEGFHFIPADDEILSCNILKNLTPKDFPEFGVLVDKMGGLESRIDIKSEQLFKYVAEI